MVCSSGGLANLFGRALNAGIVFTAVLLTGCAITPSTPSPVVSAPAGSKAPTPAKTPSSSAANSQINKEASSNPAIGTSPVLPQTGSQAAAAPALLPPPAARAAAKPTSVDDIINAEPAVVIAKEDMIDPKAQADLWERIRAGFAFTELPTPLVAEKEKFYTTKPEYLQRMFSRGGRYLFHIVEEVEKRGLPTELALLPFVESAMNPVAMSSAKAAGLWQFIPSTGKAYNLNQNWWVDNRRDVVQSTRAALDYLQKIYAMHGNDWFLALASYNWGEGAVGRAVKKNKAQDKPFDYLSLDMPAETRHYIPKLIAIKNIIAKSQQMGVALPPLPNRPYFVTIEKSRPIDLKLAAQFAGMTVDEFVALNPAHNRPVIAASKNNEIKIPADRINGFVAAVEAHTSSQKVFASWQPHTMQPGESLESIASRGNVSVAELRKANSLRPDSRIVSGTRILAPQKSVLDESKVESFVAPRVYEQVDLAAAYHTVGKKETLAGIASRYGVSVANLRSWNGGVKNPRRGASLLVRQARTQTHLTTESGERSVVNNIIKTTYRAPVAEEPVVKEKASKSKTKVTGKVVKSNAKADKKLSVKSAAKTSTKPAAKTAVKGKSDAKLVTKTSAKVTSKSAPKKKLN
jgi:membrane-bound lytic murein transglycosylase D